MTEIRLKRAYEKPTPDDGLRVLVERLWPRGLSKERAAVDLWVKDIAPSPELRRHSADILVAKACTTISFAPETLAQLSAETRHLFDTAFIRVLVRRLHAAHEALAHPRRIL